MTNHGAPSSPRGADLDHEAVTRHLRRLAAAYPAFSFSYAVLGWKGKRWWAERINRSVPGLRVVITSDLMELHTALARDKDRRHAR